MGILNTDKDRIMSNVTFQQVDETATDLQRWIDRLSHAAQTGEPLELAGSGAVDVADAQSWGPDRCIPAAALRDVLTSNTPSIYTGR
jgi:hypothetical protein